MSNKRVKVFFAILLSFALFFTSTAYADQIGDLQKQYDKIQDRIDSNKQQADDLEDQIAIDQKNVNTLETSISKADQDINALQDKIDAAQAKIDTTTIQLNAAIADYQKQDAAMKERINALYKNDTSAGFIEVILESTSFSDFITKADILKKIVNYDVDMLKEMKEKRDAINAAKVELDKEKADLLADQSTLNNKKENLLSMKKDETDAMSSLRNKVAQLNSDNEAEDRAAKLILEQIAKLQDQGGYYDGSKYAIIHRADFPAGKSPRITSGFGSRIDPITGKMGAFHQGIDIGTAGVVNIPVYAMSGGKVIIARWYGGYGNCVVIDHGGSISTLYGHNNKLLVSEGQTVAGGQKIALSGSTGRSTGPHVHFSVIKNGNYIDPSPYLLIK